MVPPGAPARWLPAAVNLRLRVSAGLRPASPGSRNLCSIVCLRGAQPVNHFRRCRSSVGSVTRVPWDGADYVARVWGPWAGFDDV